jgi:hypothetical protein
LHLEDMLMCHACVFLSVKLGVGRAFS